MKSTTGIAGARRPGGAFIWSLGCFIPVLGLLERGGFYQRIGVVPLWLADAEAMRTQFWGGRYFLALAPIGLLLWLATVVSGWKYRGAGSRRLFATHGAYLLIIGATAAYFVPFLLQHVGNLADSKPSVLLRAQLQIWAALSLGRQILGVLVLGSYVALFGIVSREHGRA